jgi:hypothetical protein
VTPRGAGVQRGGCSNTRFGKASGLPEMRLLRRTIVSRCTATSPRPHCRSGCTLFSTSSTEHSVRKAATDCAQRHEGQIAVSFITYCLVKQIHCLQSYYLALGHRLRVRLNRHQPTHITRHWQTRLNLVRRLSRVAPSEAECRCQQARGLLHGCAIVSPSRSMLNVTCAFAKCTVPQHIAHTAMRSDRASCEHGMLADRTCCSLVSGSTNRARACDIATVALAYIACMETPASKSAATAAFMSVASSEPPSRQTCRTI